jgi:hypothetical protein
MSMVSESGRGGREEAAGPEAASTEQPVRGDRGTGRSVVPASPPGRGEGPQHAPPLGERYSELLASGLACNRW